MGQPTRARSAAFADARGQAMTEAMILIVPLMMLIAAMLQIFLIDENTFRLATRAHARLFNDVAFPGNRSGTGYDTPTVSWDGPEQYVPVVGFFSAYGLTRASLRIRSVRMPPPRGGYKPVMIARGTSASIADGLMGNLDPSGWLSSVSQATSDLNRARRWRQELEQQRARSRR